jgi:hypothetical protein
MAESKTSGSSGSGASATQEKKQEKTDAALKSERGRGASKEEKAHGIERDNDGNVKPLEYPDHEPLDKVTYRDPRPLDWPQKADRSVFIGVVHSSDPDDDGSEKKGYVYAGQVREDEELELGGKQVKDAQVVGGSGQITVIADGEAINFGSLTGPLAADLRSALEMNSNS